MQNALAARLHIPILALSWILTSIMGLSPALAEMPALEIAPQPADSDQLPVPSPMASGSQCKEVPLLMAEGSNSCEIVSCGMGIKDTCKITCPADKTPKCSCDCLKTFGPMCTEYKANCKCE
jgi:hypothetical protein